MSPFATDWISINKVIGTNAVGGMASDVTVLADVTGLEVGTYIGTILLSSNDRTNNFVQIPVTLTIKNPPKAPSAGTSWSGSYSRKWSVVYQLDGISSNIHGVWGSSAKSVYAVGESGLILHYDSEDWTDVSPLAFTGNLNDAWCKNAKCSAVGQDANIFTVESEGGSWSGVYSLAGVGSLHGIWGNAANEVYACGG